MCCVLFGVDSVVGMLIAYSVDIIFCVVFFLMIRRPPRSTQSRSSAASDVYKRQGEHGTVKEVEGKNRVFVLAPGDFVVEEAAGGISELSLIHISEPTRPY